MPLNKKGVKRKLAVYESDSNTLRHYGVLGMKWGVRKNPSRAYTKAVKKKNNLEKKSSDYNLKSAKLRLKALKKSASATNEKKYKKAREIEFKANKLSLKSAKLQKKGLKWTEQMDKVFSGYDIKRLSKEEMANGKKYAYELIKRSAS